MLGRTETHALLSGRRKYARDYKKAQLKRWRACKNALWLSPRFLRDTEKQETSREFGVAHGSAKKCYKVVKNCVKKVWLLCWFAKYNKEKWSFSSNQPLNKSILALIWGLCSIFSTSIESSNPEGQSPLARVPVPGRCRHLTRLLRLT